MNWMSELSCKLGLVFLFQIGSGTNYLHITYLKFAWRNMSVTYLILVLFNLCCWVLLIYNSPRSMRSYSHVLNVHLILLNDVYVTLFYATSKLVITLNARITAWPFGSYIHWKAAGWNTLYFCINWKYSIHVFETYSLLLHGVQSRISWHLN